MHARLKNAKHRVVRFRRDWPVFYCFDALQIDSEDLRDLPLSAQASDVECDAARQSRLLSVESAP